MTFDNESSYENLVDEERRHDKPVDKPTSTPAAPQKKQGESETPSTPSARLHTLPAVVL